MNERDTYDLVCIGSGAAGCATALAAAEHGLSACVIEKTPSLGGATCFSYGGLWVGANHLQEATGIADTLADAEAYALFLSGGEAIEDNLRTYVREAPATLRRYEALGLRFRIIAGVPDHYFPEAPGSRPPGRTLEVEPVHKSALGPWADSLQKSPYMPPGVSWSDAVAWGGFGNQKDWDPDVVDERARSGLLTAGEGLAGHLVAQLVGRGVPILTETEAVALTREGARVSGVVVRRNGRETALTARRGVVIATGGYEGDPDLTRRLEGNVDWLTVFPPTTTGDGLRMGTEIGASMFHIPVNLAVMLGYRVPPETPDGRETFRNAGIRGMYPHSIVVNRAGRRFADESRFQYVIGALRRFDPASHIFPNAPCFLVFDGSYLARYSFAGRAPGAPAPDWLPRADSLAGLAARLGIDPDGLAAEVQRFNGAAAQGADPDFGRGTSPWSQSSAGDVGGGGGAGATLGPVETPPFYGIELCQSGIGSAGLLTDTRARVIHVRGHAIEGLYACGNAAGPNFFGVGYQAGFTLMGGLVFGWRAAQHAAGSAA